MNCKRIITLAAVLAAGIAQARTIAITAAHDIGGLASSFDLAIAAGERDEGLYVAYGNVDGGDDPFAWENLVKVADIPAATTSYTVSAPQGWGADVNALRFFMIDSASFHYDYAMAYLPSSGSGNDYADTGYVPSSNTKVEIDIAYYSHGSSNSDWIYLFGERSALGAIDKSFCGYMYKSGTQTSALYANIDSGGFQNGLTALGQRIKLTFVGSSVEGDNTFKVYGNGGQLLYSRQNVAAFDNAHGRSMLVFACREGNNVYNRHPRADLYGLRIWEGSTLVRDYTPCVKNGVAGLLDNVAFTFVGSATSTPFSEGPRTEANGTSIVCDSIPATVFATALPLAAIRPEIVAASDGTATIPYNLATAGAGAATADVFYRFGMSPDALGAAVLVQSAATPGNGTFTLAGLAHSTVYYVSAFATSAAGTSPDVAPVPFFTPRAGATARTAEIVSTNRTNGAVSSLDLAFSAANETNRLFMAYGDDDGGAAMASWDHADCIGDVAPYAFMTNAALPEGWRTDVYAVRYFLVRDAASVTNSTASFSLLDKPYAKVTDVVLEGHTAAAISWDLLSTGGAVAADVSVIYGVASDNLSSSAVLAQNASAGAGSGLLEGLTPGRTYFARLVASADGTEGERSPLFTIELPLPDTAAGGDGRAFTGVEIEGNVATALFGAYGITTPLYAAYGAEYGGETTNGWEHVVKVADVAPSATSQTFALPAGWGVGVNFLRFFFCLGDEVVDSFVEYVVATGTQYIETGLYPSSNLVTRLTFATSDTAHDKPIYGVRDMNRYQSEFNFVVWLGRTAGTQYAPMIGPINYNFNGRSTGKSAGERFTLTFGYYVGGFIDDREQLTSASLINTVGQTANVSSKPLVLFGLRSNGSVDNRKFYGTCWDWCAWEYDSGKVLQHLVPCVANGRTNMFDTVTGTVFADASGGQFGGGAGAVPREFFSFSDLILAQNASLPVLGEVADDGGCRGDRLAVSGTLASEGAGDCVLAVETSRIGDFTDAVSWPCAGTYGAGESFVADLYSPDVSSAAYIRPGETLWYRVRVVDAAGQVDYSAPASVTPLAALAIGSPSMTAAARTFTATIPVTAVGANTGHVWVVYGMAPATLDRETDKVVIPHDFSGASVTVTDVAPSAGTLYWSLVVSNDCSTAVWSSTGAIQSKTLSNNIRYTWKKSVSDGVWENAANWDAPEGRLDYPTDDSDAYFLNGTTTRVAIATEHVNVRQLYVYERNIDVVFHGGTDHKLLVSNNFFADATGGTICISNLEFEVTRGGVTINENRLLKFCGARVFFYNGGLLRATGGPRRHIEICGGTYFSGSGELNVGGDGSTITIDDSYVNLYATARGCFISSGSEGGEIIIKGRNARLEAVTYFRTSMDRSRGGTVTFVVPEGGYAQPPVCQIEQSDTHVFDTSRPFAGEIPASMDRVKPMTLRIDPSSPALSSRQTLRQPLVSWKSGLCLEKMILDAPAVHPRSNFLAFAAQFDASDGQYDWQRSWTDDDAPQTLGFIHEQGATVIMLR